MLTVNRVSRRRGRWCWNAQRPASDPVLQPLPVGNARRSRGHSADPSRTAMVRRRFVADLRRRVAALKRAIRKFVATDDELGLVVNAFCPTGPGGGQDNSCSSTGGSAGRFERGKVLSKDDKKKVIASVRDVYKEAGLEKSELKGYHKDSGDPVYGYPYSPELFVTSDVTGAKLRHYITLPGGEKSHPSELFPNVSQADIDRAVGEQQYQSKALAQRNKDRDARHAETKSEANAKYQATNRTLPGSWLAESPGQGIVRVDGKDPEDVAYFSDHKQITSSVANDLAPTDHRITGGSAQVRDLTLAINSEKCPHCGALMERGDDGKCNRCGEDWPVNAVGNTANARRFRFQTTDAKLAAFRKWLASRMKLQGLLFDRKATEDEWWRRYIAETYRKGQGRAFDDVMKKMRQRGELADDPAAMKQWYDAGREDFLRSSFGRPAAVERVKTMAGRTLTDLRGFSNDMATKAARTLTDGLIIGQHPLEIAKELERLFDISTGRAETIARTEIIRAHAVGQLDAMESLGVAEVGVAVEWATANDDAVCPKCRPLEGIVLSLDEARKVSIPRHPRCRCAWLPANLGEDDTGQTASRRGVQDAIKESLAEDDGGSWTGGDADIDKERPESVFNGEDSSFDEYLFKFHRPGSLNSRLLADYERALNAFCPTGEGGGQDNSCSSAGGTAGSSTEDVLAAKGGDRDAISRVVEQNQGLVRQLARKNAHGDRQLRDDLISEGNVALMRAVEQFDPEAGAKFVTYAHQKINWMQKNEVKRQGRERDRAKELSLDPEDLSGGTHEADEARETVGRALKSLDVRSAEILSASFGVGGGEPQTHREIATRLGITPARVGQLEKAALERLRKLQPVAANLLVNVFCPTGPGGGVDPGCGKGGVPPEIKAEVDFVSKDAEVSKLFDVHLVGSWAKRDPEKMPDRKGKGTSDVDFILTPKETGSKGLAKFKERDERGGAIERLKRSWPFARPLQIHEGDVQPGSANLLVNVFCPTGPGGNVNG